MKLEIATPSQSLPVVEVDEVVLPAFEGETMILPGHAHLIAQLGEGQLSYRSKSEQKAFHIAGGVFDVRDDQIIVLTDTLREVSPELKH